MLAHTSGSGRLSLENPACLSWSSKVDFHGRTGWIKPLPAPAVSDRITLDEYH